MEQTSAQKIEELETEISICKKQVELGDALVRLKKNPDFKKVFEEHYMVNEPARIVQLMADPPSQTDAVQRSCHGLIRAIGSFGQFMTMTLVMADRAEKKLENDEETRLELLGEES